MCASSQLLDQSPLSSLVGFTRKRKTERAAPLSHLTRRRALLSSRRYCESPTVFALFLFCPFDVSGRRLPATVYCCCINLTNKQATQKFCLCDTLEDLICLEKRNQTGTDGASSSSFFFHLLLLLLETSFCSLSLRKQRILLTQTVC